MDQYVRGDIVGLFKKSKKSLGKQRKLLLYDRNIVMARRIEEMILDKSAFIAVGAAHLSGKQGILRLLKKSKFKVKPIRLIME